MTVEKGLYGYYICLYDQDGPLGRVEDFDYDTYDAAKWQAERLAVEERLSFI